MTDEWKPTGVWDALLIELLLGLSMSPDAVMAMSAQERIEALRSRALVRESCRADRPNTFRYSSKAPWEAPHMLARHG